jgi:hypothetical protein
MARRTGPLKANRGWQGRCSASKLYLVDQKVNSQNGTSHSGLQKTGCEKFALKLHSFLDEAPRGDRLPICPFEKGTSWAGILVARNNAQGCPSINQIPVIGQFVCEKN